jgi:gliding motility-associated lipoprotein GldH
VASNPYFYGTIIHSALMVRSYLVILFMSFLFVGCIPTPYYQKQVPVPSNQWSYNFKPVFKFDIKDTTATYRTYFIVQHSQAYPFANIWMWMYIKVPGDSVLKKERVNITLADPQGKWLGRGMGAIYEERVGVNFGEAVPFNRVGTYEIALEQNMRVNPLPEVLHVGLRVEMANRRADR